MVNSNQSEIEKQLAELQLQFKNSLTEKRNQIEQLVKDLCRSAIDDSMLTDLHYKVYSLWGASDAFGAEGVGVAARDLELKLKLLINESDQAVSTSSLNTELAQQLEHLTSLLNQACEDWQPSSISYIPIADNNIKLTGDLIYLVDDDELFAKELITKLEYTDLCIQHFISVEDFVLACKNKMPSAVIMGMVFSGNNTAGSSVIERLKRKVSSCPPVIFISTQNDMEVRLAAARAGASRYFCKPLDERKLAKVLTGLTSRTPTKPYRVLIIDGDELLLQYYSLILQEANMEVETLLEPLQSLKVIEQFNPDVILMDVYMPNCSGLELAQVIRQDDVWLLTPIMFFSSEINLKHQLTATSFGCDDFLHKPVETSHLISAIIARAKRARWNNRLTDDLSHTLDGYHFQIEAINQHDIVSETDVAGRITKVNDKFCEISGYSRQELLGQNHRMLKSRQHSDSFYMNLWNTISSGQSWHGIICNRKKDGGEYWVKSTIVPFFDEQGKPYRYVSMRTDISEVKVSEERLARGQDNASIGTWDWNIKDGHVYWSPMANLLYGYAADLDEMTSETYFSMVHPSDIDLVNDAVAACLEHGVKYDIEHRIMWPDGSVHWVQERGDVIYGEDGKASHMLGVVQDITERMQAKILQQGNNQILEQIALGKPLTQVLNSVILHAENILDGAISSVLLRNPSENILEKGAAPNLPDFYNEAIDGIDIGMGIGSCGEAAFTGKRVIVSDIMNHPNWSAFKELAKKADLSACWSEPFSSSSGEVLGTFAIYYREPTTPNENNLELLADLAQFAAIVVERDLSQQALLEAKDEAENASRAKSQFLSSMSHELRTPMNAIMGFGQLLTMESESALTDSQQENVNEIVKAGNHLLELINEVLDLSKIEAGRIDLSLEGVALGEVISESIQLITPLANNRGIEIRLTKEGDDLTLEKSMYENNAVRADRIRLRQVLLNLLSNAVKYNNENGKIIIDYQPEKNNQTRISVTDTGDGISLEGQSQLFKAFNRLGVEQNQIEGSGIGLVITKNIIELMGGNIGVDSQPDKGSTFWFELPTAALLPEQENMKKNSEDMSKEISLDHEYTVLYIEDNPANLRLVAQLLGRMNNIHMWSAHEPLLGLELAAEHKPDLILLDINLPGMDGHSVLKQLRLREETRDTPIIAISANAMPKDIEKSMEAGFDDYITKPINVEALLQSVNERLMDK